MLFRSIGQFSLNDEGGRVRGNEGGEEKQLNAAHKIKWHAENEQWKERKEKEKERNGENGVAARCKTASFPPSAASQSDNPRVEIAIDIFRPVDSLRLPSLGV